MLRRIGSLVLLITACGSPEQDEPIVGAATVSVEHYDYHFDLESREATAILRLIVEQAGDCFSLPMRSAALSGVLLDGEVPISASLELGKASLCGVGWPAGTVVEFTSSTTVPLETWGDSQVGYSVTMDIEGNAFSYLVSWVGGCDQFGPCDTQTAAFATYRFTIDHPDDQQVLCPGTITTSAAQTICEFDYDGGPTYSSFGFAASPSWEKIDLGDWGGIDVSFYDMPTAGLAGRFNAAEHKDFTGWMIENFGPYPYGSELRFAVGPTYWNGFEHPGNILLNDRLSTGGFGESFTNPLAHTTSHEIAHQWAGDQTTLASTYDFVWKEAMAEYLVYVHQDEHVSSSAAFKTLSAWKKFAAFSEYYLVPAEQPALLDYYGDVYGPGPMILFRQLEAIFDRRSVMTALSSVLGTPHAISIDDVQAALEASTGANLGNYFSVWVHGEGAPSWPFYDVSTAVVDGGVELRIVQQNPQDGLFGCAFDVALKGAEGEELIVRVNLGVDGMESYSKIVEPTFEVASLQFDVNRECLGKMATTTAAPLHYDPALDHPWVSAEGRAKLRDGAR